MSLSTIQKKRVPQKKTTVARVAYAIHSAAGLWFAVLLTLVMITGTLAVLGHELDQLFYANLRVNPPKENPLRVNPGKLYDAVAAAYPGTDISQITIENTDPYAPATTQVAVSGKDKRTIAINPYSGEVIGEVPSITIRSFLLRVHASLFQRIIGLSAVNFCGVVLLVLLLSGLIVYKRFWKNFFRKPRFARGTRIMLGDLHRLAALWSLPFILIIAVTGSWYFYNFPLAYLGIVPDVVGLQPAPPRISEADLDALGPNTPTPLSGEELVDRVRAVYPNMSITGLMPPRNLNMPFVVYGKRGEHLYGEAPNSIYLNPYTGKIIGSFLAEDLQLNQHVFQTMSQLHHGTLFPHHWGYGPRMVMKGLWFIFGVGGSFLCISGLWMHLLRRRHRAKGLIQLWNWIKPWGGPMGIFKYPNILVIPALLLGIYHTMHHKPQARDSAKFFFAEQAVGPFTVSLQATSSTGNASPFTTGERIVVFPRIAQKKFRAARSIHIGVAQEHSPAKGGVRVKGAEKTAFAPVRLPADLHDAQLWLEITQWDGSTYRAYWPLSSAQSSIPSPASKKHIQKHS